MSSRRAVIVDDDKLIRRVIDRTLTRAGFMTAQAGTGKDGLALIESFSPELVILDIFMPGDYDGVEVCRRLRDNNRFRGMVIVMISASDQRREAKRSIEAGADIFIPKPFSPKYFMEQIKLILRKKGELS
jgi:DNA-binding response OmpR family regulator